MSNNSLVLRREVDVREAMDAVRAAVTELNRELRAEWYYTESSDLDGVQIYTWDEPVHRYGTIRLNDDPFVPALYVSFEVQSSVRSTVGATLRKHVHAVPEQELQDDAEHGVPTRQTALMRLGIGEERLFDERTLRIVTAALESPDVEERRAATMAMFLLKWSAFAPAIERALAKEPDESLREQLAYTSELCRGQLIL
jgi:hypothetical protein